MVYVCFNQLKIFSNFPFLWWAIGYLGKCGLISTILKASQIALLLLSNFIWWTYFMLFQLFQHLFRFVFWSNIQPIIDKFQYVVEWMYIILLFHGVLCSSLIGLYCCLNLYLFIDFIPNCYIYCSKRNNEASDYQEILFLSSVISIFTTWILWLCSWVHAFIIV